MSRTQARHSDFETTRTRWTVEATHCRRHAPRPDDEMGIEIVSEQSSLTVPAQGLPGPTRHELGCGRCRAQVSEQQR